MAEMAKRQREADGRCRHAAEQAAHLFPILRVPVGTAGAPALKNNSPLNGGG